MADTRQPPSPRRRRNRLAPAHRQARRTERQTDSGRTTCRLTAGTRRYRRRRHRCSRRNRQITRFAELDVELVPDAPGPGRRPVHCDVGQAVRVEVSRHLDGCPDCVAGQRQPVVFRPGVLEPRDLDVVGARPRENPHDRFVQSSPEVIRPLKLNSRAAEERDPESAESGTSNTTLTVPDPETLNRYQSSSSWVYTLDSTLPGPTGRADVLVLFGSNESAKAPEFTVREYRLPLGVAAVARADLDEIRPRRDGRHNEQVLARRGATGIGHRRTRRVRNSHFGTTRGRER